MVRMYQRPAVVISGLGLAQHKDAPVPLPAARRVPHVPRLAGGLQELVHPLGHSGPRSLRAARALRRP